MAYSSLNFIIYSLSEHSVRTHAVPKSLGSHRWLKATHAVPKSFWSHCTRWLKARATVDLFGYDKEVLKLLNLTIKWRFHYNYVDKPPYLGTSSFVLYSWEKACTKLFTQQSCHWTKYSLLNSRLQESLVICGMFSQFARPHLFLIRCCFFFNFHADHPDLFSVFFCLKGKKFNWYGLIDRVYVQCVWHTARLGRHSGLKI